MAVAETRMASQETPVGNCGAHGEIEAWEAEVFPIKKKSEIFYRKMGENMTRQFREEI